MMVLYDEQEVMCSDLEWDSWGKNWSCMGSKTWWKAGLCGDVQNVEENLRRQTKVIFVEKSPKLYSPFIHTIFFQFFFKFRYCFRPRIKANMFFEAAKWRILWLFQYVDILQEIRSSASGSACCRPRLIKNKEKFSLEDIRAIRFCASSKVSSSIKGSCL